MLLRGAWAPTGHLTGGQVRRDNIVRTVNEVATARRAEMSEIDRDLRSSQVATAVGLSAASIQAYARKGLIPYRLTPGRQYRFNLAEVRQLLAPEALTPADGLPDVFTADAPVVDALSGYRPDPVGAAAISRLRVRAVRAGNAHGLGRASMQPADGSVELDTLIARSGGAAVAVLRRSA
jgi:hypothetical protein